MLQQQQSYKNQYPVQNFKTMHTINRVDCLLSDIDKKIGIEQKRNADCKLTNMV